MKLKTKKIAPHKFLYFALKVAFIFLILSFFYFSFYLSPKIKRQKEISDIKRYILTSYYILVQNKISYVFLTRLDEKSPDFNLEKSEIIESLKSTQKRGLEYLGNPIPKESFDKNLSATLSTLSLETEKIYEEQKNLLDKVFSTKSYQEGLNLLKSKEAVNLLTRQTNLLLEYQFWLERLAQEEKNLSNLNLNLNQLFNSLKS